MNYWYSTNCYKTTKKHSSKKNKLDYENPISMGKILWFKILLNKLNMIRKWMLKYALQSKKYLNQLRQKYVWNFE